MLLKSDDSELLNSLKLLPDPLKYNYLSKSAINVPSLDDKALFKELLECLEVSGFSEQEISAIFKLLSVIL
jgi:myosin heavy subunit